MKIFNLLFLLILSLLLVTCKNKKRSPDSRKRLYFKEVKQGENIISWFFYSNISNISPFYLTVSNKERDFDTICASTNLTDFRIKKDTIFLSFDGTPKLYQNSILIPSKSKYYYLSYHTQSRLNNKIWENIYTYSKEGKKSPITHK